MCIVLFCVDHIVIGTPIKLQAHEIKRILFRYEKKTVQKQILTWYINATANAYWGMKTVKFCIKKINQICVHVHTWVVLYLLGKGRYVLHNTRLNLISAYFWDS